MPRKATFGTIISGTMQSRDLLPAFIVKFESLSGEAFAEQETVDALLLCEQEDWLNDAGQATLSEITNNLVDSLDAFAPDYGYFGAHPGDGADFGFWLHEDWQQMATDDDVLLIEDLADVPADYEGMLCVVNDHGNATLYSRQFIGTDRANDAHWAHTEIWSIV